MSDTEESRTATVGRKRRQNGDAVQTANGGDSGKRQKLDPDANFIALDSEDNSLSDASSKESGEVSSTSGRSSRRASKSSRNESEEVAGSFEDLNGKASSKQQGPPYLDLEAIFPPEMQKWVEQQMKGTSQTPEEILKHAATSKEKGQAFGRASKQFLDQWNGGFRRIFPDCSFLELQRVVESPEAFRRPFNISTRRKGQLNDRLEHSMSKNPDELPQFVLLGWILDVKMHTPACKAMKYYVDHNLVPQFTPINKAPPNRAAQSGPTVNNSLHASVTADAKKQRPASRARTTATDSEASSSGSDSDSDDASSNDASSPADPNALLLRDLSDYDQTLQTRYFNITSPNSPIRCFSCAEPGHLPATCPALVCAHCNSRSHLTRQCPPHHKCTRCRRRGHSGKTCTRATVQPGAPGDNCDVCGKAGHAEEECIGLWTTYDPDKAPRHRISREKMAVGCYNCGQKDHWGDDCEDLPGFVKLKYDTFSRKNAERYIIGGEEESKEVQMGERDGGVQGRSVQPHQLAQLGDFY